MTGMSRAICYWCWRHENPPPADPRSYRLWEMLNSALSQLDVMRWKGRPPPYEAHREYYASTGDGAELERMLRHVTLTV